VCATATVVATPFLHAVEDSALPTPPPIKSDALMPAPPPIKPDALGPQPPPITPNSLTSYVPPGGLHPVADGKASGLLATTLSNLANMRHDMLKAIASNLRA
ncbi:MAG TPA: hypothetical protein VFK10_00590, partial [Burkholderiaceae bacterium]|nr:hypothetical protein [Burkholderiaceae bacterium]